MLPLRRLLTHRQSLPRYIAFSKTMSTFLTLADITPPRLPPLRPPNSSKTITLTPDEDRLCTLLNDCTETLKGTRPDLEPIECRIAGGWVRDKLLGKESNDIDIALSSIMGIAFAELFVPYLEERGIEIRSVAKIASNPEQSKHLETCRATILGLEIDFVNLRSEEYADGSRIPTHIRCGTPSEDALRRDLTINALFYNVHTRQVEDYTGKGLVDLLSGVARTPLKPKETFLDDPLRVLRCVRFASRFGLELDAELEAAAGDKDVKHALVTKISRERVAEELDKMFKGRDPLYTFQLIESLGIHEDVFLLPDHKFQGILGDRRSSVVAVTILQGLLSEESPLKAWLKVDERLLLHARGDLGTRRRLYLASALLPFRKLEAGPKQKQTPISAVIRDGLKLGNQNHYLSGVPLLIQAPNVVSLPSTDMFSSPTPRVAIGLALRDPRISSSYNEAHWTASVLFCLVVDLVELWDLEVNHINVSEAQRVVDMYNAFVTEVVNLNLESEIETHPKLDGRELCDLLGGSPGAWVNPALAKVVEWQLEHPDGSKDDCRAFLMGEVGNGKLVVGDAKRSPRDAEAKRKKVKS